MQVGSRMFAHLWRARCPIPGARLKARRGLVLVGKGLQGDSGLTLFTFLVYLKGGGLV